MMKKFILILILLLVPCQFVLAQVDIYGIASFGSVVQKGQPAQNGMFVGGDIPFAEADTVKGMTVFSRTGVFYSDGSEDIQALMSLVMVQKRLGLIPTVYFGIGSGVTHQIKDDEDMTDLTFKFELGTDILGGVGLQAGIDYSKVDGGADRMFYYVSANLSPLL